MDTDNGTKVKTSSIFESIDRKSSRNRVYDAMREAIFSGKLTPGLRLTETGLANDFNVSRVVIREALQQLAHDGLVVQNSYKGTNVVKLDSEEVNEILAVRSLLEGEAIRLAMPRLTDDDRSELKRMAIELDSTSEPSSHTELDFAFHQRIWELSGNQTLKRILTHLSAPFFAMAVIVRQSKEHDPYAKGSDIGKHTQVVESLIGGTIAEAVAAMQTHIGQNRNKVGESFDRFIGTDKD